MLPIPDLAPGELTDAIEALYNIRVSAPPTALPSGFHSRAWRVPTTSGSWVAKLSSPASDPITKLERQVGLANYLHQHGVRAPQNLPVRDGSFVTMLTVGQQHYPLQLVKHERLNRIQPGSASGAALVSIGEFVARLHDILDAYPERDTIVADRRKSADEWGIRTNGLWPEVAALPEAAQPPAAERAWFRAVDQQAVAWLRHHILDPATLSMAVLHGDLNFEHIRLLDDGTPYVFDFGDMCWGPIAHELAVLFLNIYLDGELSFAEWEAICRHILAGYSAQRQLSGRDQEMIAVLLVNRVLARAQYSVELAQEIELAINWNVLKQTYELIAGAVLPA